jgi:hypothetical protein
MEVEIRTKIVLTGDSITTRLKLEMSNLSVLDQILEVGGGKKGGVIQWF